MQLGQTSRNSVRRWCGAAAFEKDDLFDVLKHGNSKYNHAETKYVVSSFSLEATIHAHQKSGQKLNPICGFSPCFAESLKSYGCWEGFWLEGRHGRPLCHPPPQPSAPPPLSHARSRFGPPRNAKHTIRDMIYIYIYCVYIYIVSPRSRSMPTRINQERLFRVFCRFQQSMFNAGFRR